MRALAHRCMRHRRGHSWAGIQSTRPSMRGARDPRVGVGCGVLCLLPVSQSDMGVGVSSPAGEGGVPSPHHRLCNTPHRSYLPATHSRQPNAPRSPPPPRHTRLRRCQAAHSTAPNRRHIAATAGHTPAPRWPRARAWSTFPATSRTHHLCTRSRYAPRLSSECATLWASLSRLGRRRAQRQGLGLRHELVLYRGQSRARRVSSEVARESCPLSRRQGRNGRCCGSHRQCRRNSGSRTTLAVCAL